LAGIGINTWQVTVTVVQDSAYAYLRRDTASALGNIGTISPKIMLALLTFLMDSTVDESIRRYSANALGQLNLYSVLAKVIQMISFKNISYDDLTEMLSATPLSGMLTFYLQSVANVETDEKILGLITHKIFDIRTPVFIETGKIRFVEDNRLQNLVFPGGREKEIKRKLIKTLKKY
jgi:hypothetical protein